MFDILKYIHGALHLSTWAFVLLISVLSAAIGGSLAWVFDKAVRAQALIQSPASADPPSRQSAGEGGKGGDAKVGGTGIAIGGPGGHAGTSGRGGDGGSAEVRGDGLAAGGAGGSVDSDTLWSPPAPSGYEVAKEALGEPIDPKMRQYGRGGMSPGYAFRYNTVEKIRAEYFEAHNQTPQSALENVKAVPLEYINGKLALTGVKWRARIVRGLVS